MADTPKTAAQHNTAAGVTTSSYTYDPDMPPPFERPPTASKPDLAATLAALIAAGADVEMRTVTHGDERTFGCLVTLDGKRYHVCVRVDGASETILHSALRMMLHSVAISTPEHLRGGGR